MTLIKPPEFVRIGEAARILKVSIDTLRNWDKWNWLKPSRSSGNQRMYRTADLERLLTERQEEKP